MKLYYLICSAILWLRLYQATIVLRYPEAESKFVEAKTGYDPKNDPFNNLLIEDRAEVCDKVLKAGQFVFVDGVTGKLVEPGTGPLLVENFQTLVIQNGSNKTSTGNDDLNDQSNLKTEEKNATKEEKDRPTKKIGSSHNDIDTITIKDKVMRFKRFPCFISEEYQWYLSYGLNDQLHFLLERKASNPLAVVAIVDLTPIHATFENELDNSLPDKEPESNTTGALEADSQPSDSVCNLKPYEKYQLCSTAWVVAEETDAKRMQIYAERGDAKQGQKYIEELDVDGSGTTNLKTTEFFPGRYMFWYNNDQEENCQKSRISVTKNEIEAYESYTIDTLACLYNGNPIDSTELYVALGAQKGTEPNDVHAILLTPSDEDEETKLQVRASIDIHLYLQNKI